MNETSSPLRVLFLSSDSGGGHTAVARSMIEGIREHVEVDADVVNIYQTRGLHIWPFLSKIRAKSQMVWRAVYRTTDHNWFIRQVWKRLSPSFMRPLFRVISETDHSSQPDVVVAVHHASAQCLEPLALGLTKRPLTVVCVTDYDVHANWIAEADLYLASSDLAFQKLSDAGKNVRRLPMLPCRIPDRVNSKTVETEENVFRIVMVMGLEGSSCTKAKRLIDELLRSPFSGKIEVDVICGRNQKLHAQLSEDYRGQDRIGVHGFVTDIPDRMRKANLALIRLSPQTMTETLAAGTPVIGFDWHAHEAECLNVLHQFGAGTGSLEIDETLQRVQQFIEDDQLRDQWYARAHQASNNAVGSELAARWILEHTRCHDQPIPCDLCLQVV